MKTDEDRARAGLARLKRTGAKIGKLQRQAHELSNALLIAEVELDLALREIRQSLGGDDDGKTNDNLEAR